MTVGALVFPGRIMPCKRGELCTAVFIDTDQDDVFHGISDEEGEVSVRVIMIAVEGHVDFSVDGPVLMSEPEVGRPAGSRLLGEDLGPGGGNRPSVPVPPVVKDNISPSLQNSCPTQSSSLWRKQGRKSPVSMLMTQIRCCT